MPSKRSTDPGGSSNRTSQSLIGLIKTNDADAWDRLVFLYSPLIYFWCHRSGLPSQEIPDVFQEVFHAVARNIHKFRHDRNGTFRGWLSMLTRNKVNDHYRKTGREPRPAGGTEAKQFFELIPSTEPQDESAENDDELYSGETEISIRRELLQRALSNIRPHFQEQTWQAFWRVVIDGRETNDVAAELSMQPGTIRVAKSRVLKRLRQEFGDSED
jgi:RNA polymerase sigma-70 factor (ECF subfamily)